MTLKNKRVFVSGAVGVIGRELIRLLDKQGAIILAADRKSRPASFPKSVIYRQGDLNYITQEELDGFAPEIFFHLAASFERSTESYEFWEENFRDNVALSHHLITLLKDSLYLKKVIFPSSYLIYSESLYSFDTSQDKPRKLAETDPIYPRNLTGSAKLNHEIELNFIKEFKPKTQIVLARIYRGFGCNSRDVISRWVRTLLAGEEITVYHKENIFDYIYAEDTAEGLMQLSLSNFSGVVNLGTGHSEKIENVVEILKKHFPKLKARYEDIKMSYEASEADTTKLEKVTGWLPRHNVAQAIDKIIKFEKSRSKSTPEQTKNVLATCISKKVPMIKAIRKAIDKIGSDVILYGGDMNQDCIGRYFVDKFVKMPAINEENSSAIFDICRKNNIGAVIPSRDSELIFWAKNKDRLDKEGILVMVSDAHATEAMVDKLKFYEVCEIEQIPAIETFDDLERIKADRVVVKERFGAGAKSMLLNATRVKAQAHAKTLESPIFQPFISGKEMSVDLYVDRAGKVKGVVVRERTQVVDGESQITKIIRDEKLEKMIAVAAEKLKLYGHVLFQVIRDKKDNYHIIECNSRFGGASTSSLSYGLDSFYWFLLEAMGENIGQYPFLPQKRQLTQVRHVEDLII